METVLTFGVRHNVSTRDDDVQGAGTMGAAQT